MLKMRLYILALALLTLVASAWPTGVYAQEAAVDTASIGAMINKALGQSITDPTAALQTAEQAADMATAAGVLKYKFVAYKTLGTIAWDMGRYGEAFFQYDRARRLLMIEAPGDSVRNAEICYLSGKLNAARENYPAAIDLYNRALDFTNDAKYPQLAMGITMAMGKSLVAMNDTGAARSSFEQILLLHVQTPDPANAAQAYVELANLDMLQKKFSEAEKNLNEAEAMLGGDQQHPLFPSILAQKANLEIRKGDLNKALAYRKQERDLLEKVGDLDPLARSYAAIGDIYMKLEDLNNAETTYKKALQIAEKLTKNSPLGPIFKGLADVFAKKGDYKQAFYFFRRYAEFQDSLYNSEKVRRIYDQATQHELDGKDKEIEQQKLQNRVKEEELRAERTQRNALIGFAVMSVIILVLVGVALVNNRKSAANLRQKNLMIQNQNKIILEKNKVLEDRNSRMVQLHAEKNNIIRVVSHDLKAPLNRINGLAQLIQIDPDNQAIYLKYIADVVADGTRLIQDLLDISAIENNRLILRKSLFNLADDLQEVVNSYAGVSQKKNINIRLDLPNHELPLYSDRYAIKRVFENLLSNALKFSPRELSIFIRVFKNEGKLCIAVKDQGPGLTADDKEKLFTPYQRLSATPTGGENSTGLGLSIAKRLMEELSGDLWVDSTEGNGACFVMELPDRRDPDASDLEAEQYLAAPTATMGTSAANTSQMVDVAPEEEIISEQQATSADEETPRADV